MTENSVKVAISTDFLTAYSALPRGIQGKVTEFINKFRNNPKSPGINFEKLENGADKKICSVRIDDTYRGIVVRQEETGVYLLLWVDHHDEAYQWAARKRCEVNPQTGAIQVFDMQVVQPENADTTDGLFAGTSKSDLLKLGVPEPQVPFVKSLLTKEDLYRSESSLPHDAYEALSWLAEGFPLEEVIDLMEAESPENKAADDNLAAALESPESLKSFVVVEGEEELRRIMAAPLEKWRVFLHPTQRKIVNRTYNGPARVLGGAGTGKTVVAMHRARALAAKCASDERVLFTTFTANLASDIKENLKKICTIEELRKIEVIHLDAWVGNYLRELGYDAAICYDAEIKKLWDDAVSDSLTDLGFDTGFYEEEYNRVVVSQEAFSFETYMKANRNGRGTPLNRKKRVDVWNVIDAYQKLMKERGIRDVNTAMYECKTLLIQKNSARPRYKNIIVDEGQDLSDNAYRLIRALAGAEHEDDIFIVGDAHQRIYKNRAVLSRCGINIRGRSNTLKINYRTTEEIRKYAFALLNGIPFDDLDADFDLGDKCQSLTHGIAPVIRSFPNAEKELEFIISEINQLVSSGVPMNNICVVGRTHKVIEDYIAKMTAKGIRSYEIRRNKSDDHNYDGVRIATMHRVKGLEFRYVFVVSVNHRIVPLISAIDHTDAISERETLTAEKCLLYVALTRAQKGAYITSFGKPSEFLC